MIKLYFLMVLISGSQAVSEHSQFSSVADCVIQAEVLVQEKLRTGRYDKVEYKCAPVGGAEI